MSNYRNKPADLRVKCEVSTRSVAAKQRSTTPELRAEAGAGLLGSFDIATAREHDMNGPQHKIDPANKGRPYLEEADIGSGEKTPAQLETEEMIRQIPPLPHPSRQADTGTAPPAG
jgi:hypothetical protein